MEKAYFAAGCFWCIEDTFRQTGGVTDTSVGYMGGHVDHVTYKQVCTGTTGHAEVVEVTFDPERIGYEDLLALFWKMHDPTQVNRQGPDVGTQYRSAIFCTSEAQTAAATASKAAADASGNHGRPIATQIEPAPAYWIAEDYHQQYNEKRRVRQR